MHNIYQHGRCSTHIIVSCAVEFFVPLFKMIKTQNNASNHPSKAKQHLPRYTQLKAHNATCIKQFPTSLRRPPPPDRAP